MLKSTILVLLATVAFSGEDSKLAELPKPVQDISAKLEKDILSLQKKAVDAITKYQKSNEKKFDEATKALIDKEVNRINELSGKIGQSLLEGGKMSEGEEIEFDGKSYFSFSPKKTYKADLTVECIVKNVDSGIIFGNYAGNWCGYKIAVDKGRVRFETAEPKNHKGYTCGSTKAGASGEWIHIAGVFNAKSKTIQLYVNGKLENEVKDAELAADKLTDVYVGKYPWCEGGYFTGSVKEIKVYDCVRYSENFDPLIQSEDKNLIYRVVKLNGQLQETVNGTKLSGPMTIPSTKK